MRSQLSRISPAEKQSLTETVCSRLRASSGPHYLGADVDTLHGRCERLVAELMGAAEGDPTAFVRYISGIAEERITEGYMLEELQTMLGILEEQLWQLCDRSFGERQTLLDNLRRVTTTIGMAKDQLARVYLDRAVQADARVEQLQRKIDELFKGTDAVLDTE